MGSLRVFGYPQVVQARVWNAPILDPLLAPKQPIGQGGPTWASRGGQAGLISRVHCGWFRINCAQTLSSPSSPCHASVWARRSHCHVAGMGNRQSSMTWIMYKPRGAGTGLAPWHSRWRAGGASGSRGVEGGPDLRAVQSGLRLAHPNSFNIHLQPRESGERRCLRQLLNLHQWQ